MVYDFLHPQKDPLNAFVIPYGFLHPRGCIAPWAPTPKAPARPAPLEGWGTGRTYGHLLAMLQQLQVDFRPTSDPGELLNSDPKQVEQKDHRLPQTGPNPKNQK